MKRQHETGIWQDGNTWIVRVQFQRNGKPYDSGRKTHEGLTLVEAQRLKAEMTTALHKRADDDEAGSKSKETFEGFWQTWADHLIATGRARETTMAIRKAIAQSLLFPYFGAMLMTSISRANVAKWIEWVAQLRQPSTGAKGRKNKKAGQPYSRDYLTSAWRDLRAIFGEARNLINLEANPTDGQRFTVKAENTAAPRVKRALTNEEADALLIASKPESLDIQALLWLCLTCGVRFSEATALTWADVDFSQGKNGVISINKSQVCGKVGPTKNAKNRPVVIHPDCAPFLLAHRAKQAGGKILPITALVFPSETGGYRYPSVLTKPLGNCCKRAGIDKHISAHSLRRTANNLARIHCDDTAARKMLGHVSEGEAGKALTARYSDVEIGEMERIQMASFGRLGQGKAAAQEAAKTQDQGATVIPLGKREA